MQADDRQRLKRQPLHATASRGAESTTAPPVKAQPAAALPLTVAEVLGASSVALMAELIVVAYLVDAVGLALDPSLVAACLLAAAAVTALAAIRDRPRLCLDGWRLIGFLAVVGILCAYVVWLARPSFLPLNRSPDMVHHVALIDFIQRQRSLVHDRRLNVYLGEMVDYSPGGHILAAFVASWLGTTGIRVLHPLLALLVAIKAGLVYNIVLRLLPRPGRGAALALAGATFLLYAYAYFIGSFTDLYFYPQVVSETLVVAMLWAVAAWQELRSTRVLAFFGLAAAAAWLTWPVWLPIPIGTLLILLVADRAAPARRRIVWLAVGLGPLLLLVATYAAGRVDSAQSILKAEGYVIRPFVELYGRPLLALALVGLVASLWRWRPLSLLFFGAGTVLETVLLFVYDALHAVKSFYLANKMFYLWLYPLVIFAALGLEALWRGSQRWWPGAWRRREPALRAALLVVVLVAALRRDLPYQPPSTVTEPVYQAGLWAKANLPSGCVDYLVDGWITAYWLHVGVLGNRRESPRTEALVGAFDFSRFDLAHWVAEEGRPFAIVGDLARQAPRAQTKFAVIYRSEPAAVVQRTGDATCQNREPPIEQAAIAPRPPTLASSLAGLLEGGSQLGR